MVREGLGYTMRDYDPCFNFNADRFCCSQGNARLWQNLAMSHLPAQRQIEHSYNTPRNYNPADLQMPLYLRQSGMVQDQAYTFGSTDQWHVPCSKMPCGIYKNRVPCGSRLYSFTE